MTFAELYPSLGPRELLTGCKNERFSEALKIATAVSFQYSLPPKWTGACVGDTWLPLNSSKHSDSVHTDACRVGSIGDAFLHSSSEAFRDSPMLGLKWCEAGKVQNQRGLRGKKITGVLI